MANQNNYSEKLTNLQNQRPYRLTSTDYNRIFKNNKQVVFGTSEDDNVEIWFYSPNGELIANTLLRPEDPAVSLYSVVDNTGVSEFLNIDLDTIAERIELPAGRYSVTLNFFRDEVGSLDGYKMTIDEISSNRTELRVSLVEPTPERIFDLYEFSTPSVPKLYAQALTDQLFGKNLDLIPEEQITHGDVISRMITYVPNLLNRIENSGATSPLINLIEELKNRAYEKAIENIVEDIDNKTIQQIDLESYLDKAINDVLEEFKQEKKLDARFQLT